MEDPYPTGKYPDQKVWVWVPFSSLNNSDLLSVAFLVWLGPLGKGPRGRGGGGFGLGFREIPGGGGVFQEGGEGAGGCLWGIWGQGILLLFFFFPERGTFTVKKRPLFDENAVNSCLSN